MKLRTVAIRGLKYIYRSMPEYFRARFDVALTPLTWRIATRSQFKSNTSLGAPPLHPVSIVIPSYNDVKLLKGLLTSLEKTCNSFNYEVIISDDYCDDHNNLKLKTLENSKVTVVYGDKRRGFAGAVNRGIAQARWDVVLLNSDIVAKPYWLENLQAAAYNLDPKIGLVSPHLLYPSGRIQYGGTFHASMIAPQWFAHLDQGRFANYKNANTGKYVEAISGACVYIKQEVLKLVPFLDDEYWLGFEDVDYAFSVRSKGFRAYVEPSSKLVHLESATRGKTQGMREYASMRRFWGKWTKPQSNVNRELSVVFFVSDVSTQTLKIAAEAMKETLHRSGISSTIEIVDTTSRVDELLVEKYLKSDVAKISLDVASQETVWLAGEFLGNRYCYFLGNNLSGFDHNIPEHIALLKPEFEYVAPNQLSAENLEKVMPWRVKHIVAPPPLTPLAYDINHATIVRVIFVSESDGTFAKQILKLSNTLRIEHFDELNFITEYVRNPSSFNDALIVLMRKQESSLLPGTLMAGGTPFMCPFEDWTALEVLDGLNCFRFDSANKKVLPNKINAIIEHLSSSGELRDMQLNTGNQILLDFPQKFMQVINSTHLLVTPRIETRK